MTVDTPVPPPGVPPLLATADADRHTGGPYAAAAVLARALFPSASPDVIAARDIELRAIAPDLPVPLVRTTLSDTVPRAERILIPAPQRTLRVANGFAEFVRDALAAPASFLVTGYAAADPVDREIVDVLVRRVPGLTVIVCDLSGPAPKGPAPFWGGPSGQAVEGPAAARAAVEWCQERGCHHAVVEIGRRGLALAEPDTADWWAIVHAVAVGLGALEREDEAEELLCQARARTTDPARQSTMAYTSAMLLTRHHDPARRDLEAALAWVNIGIALCGLLPDRPDRAVKLGFDMNGKALIQARRGRSGEAMELVEAAIALADADLPEGAQRIHRLVLRANRAQLRVRVGDLEGALADLDAVIAADPGYPDYYVDRGNLLAKLGREDDALADYRTAARVGPPFAEAYYNCAEIGYARGDLEGALADLDYALELDPDFVDALANRAGLLTAVEEYDRARADVDHGLAVDPGNPYLLCALGQIEHAAGDVGRARAAFDRAVRTEPSLAVAWAGRGMLAYERGDVEAAIADLGRAVELNQEPGLLFNRALALRAAGRHTEAAADLARAHALDPADPDITAALTETPDDQRA
ncbi:tetratricopeptide repeat protein [Actinocorallia sp. A-T 12471]|uniref:tetratricopeptide repeat protein n=1 Tax=Actinocorallia sp. A-T 12471 TaxID=3089813 RepID=UPI0029CFF78D|nr:tetratricopeptide repeat protein [Actinocorallia sp. A-T 12471]MDX6744460.1 tetratricopeptide repeat protein [Actinocorallia sp. A-T 12471]